METDFNPDYADMWVFGINSAFRIGDLLSVRYSHRDGNLLKLTESKTKKTREIRLNSRAQSIMDKRQAARPDDVFLFQSHSPRLKRRKQPQPYSRQAVSLAFQSVGKKLKIRLGTHSMRKTRGFRMYSDGVPLAVICKMLNHSSERETLRYIGIERDTVLSTYDAYEL